ncbi:flagellar basal body rod protein FlgC [bacterium (Candidatus Blackallbacteria) CG17_big_fil_post_rev_8_21_14_2_50_48_46]|uniref:Flagellar basal-body rod protein FlgC n=1 Tax=bacterium (Candidatus Blackallbacteria) CG17_big_fil_post_rev_8_21_14_2_50_48_46 TaxID=2014261 RepID=A0A2M7G9B5_9BACT|nr:MAG: flagellar basal body rod protein FlgC [bacterium (Candidatus Blackallbacteria) CG18_big_fil_WC_8_21_14_2_50_49_26]PIW18700.1 MAG: flagellar basal body rod protein FlgC [bacterium (Candidatus Blackallbacteria) CG17_big_fil_post_rev_8_21_14_2_50_48_46]PIW46314.1 MAG: flagellar basal body rod protein FlgC [bacterium (Candidatus Blackallbacteria) CG13_big_fil_rev_8_21_14_2_50_49_14]
MSFQNDLRISASALSAQRLRMNAISNNLANANTTRTAEGGPYQRQQVVFRPIFEQNFAAHLRLKNSHGEHLTPQFSQGEGVKAVAITQDTREGKMVYEPDHPDANAQGYVEYPNINVVAEMTDMISASRAYEANITATQTIKNMAMKALEIGRA